MKAWVNARLPELLMGDIYSIVDGELPSVVASSGFSPSHNASYLTNLRDDENLLSLATS